MANKATVQLARGQGEPEILEICFKCDGQGPKMIARLKRYAQGYRKGLI